MSTTHLLGGEKHAFLLYGDTDSVCYVEHEDFPAIAPGRYLGEMSDEFPGETIEEFICAGNKQYAIRLRDNDTGEVRHCFHVYTSIDVFAFRRLKRSNARESPRIVRPARSSPSRI